MRIYFVLTIVLCRFININLFIVIVVIGAVLFGVRYVFRNVHFRFSFQVFIAIVCIEYKTSTNLLLLSQLIDCTSGYAIIIICTTYCQLKPIEPLPLWLVEWSLDTIHFEPPMLTVFV